MGEEHARKMIERKSGKTELRHVSSFASREEGEEVLEEEF